MTDSKIMSDSNKMSDSKKCRIPIKFRIPKMSDSNKMSDSKNCAGDSESGRQFPAGGGEVAGKKSWAGEQGNRFKNYRNPCDVHAVCDDRPVEAWVDGSCKASRQQGSVVALWLKPSCKALQSVSHREYHIIFTTRSETHITKNTKKNEKNTYDDGEEEE